MGEIYLFCTTIPVGAQLNPFVLPSKDYLQRAWIIQERSFGPCKMLWTTEACKEDMEFCRSLVAAFLRIEPKFEALVNTLRNGTYWDDLGYSRGVLKRAGNKYPEAWELLQKVRELKGELRA